MRPVAAVVVPRHVELVAIIGVVLVLHSARLGQARDLPFRRLEDDRRPFLCRRLAGVPHPRGTDPPTRQLHALYLLVGMFPSATDQLLPQSRGDQHLEAAPPDRVPFPFVVFQRHRTQLVVLPTQLQRRARPAAGVVTEGDLVPANLDPVEAHVPFHRAAHSCQVGRARRYLVHFWFWRFLRTAYFLEGCNVVVADSKTLLAVRCRRRLVMLCGKGEFFLCQSNSAT